MLSDNEGTLLGLVVRAEPITAYQIGKVYERSPVSNFNTSTGKLYPLIRRLSAKGLLIGSPVAGDARGTEKLMVTDLGREMVRRWCMELKEAHLLLEDPLRSKLQSFDLLSPDEQIEWCTNARAMLAAKLRQVEVYREGAESPFLAYVHAGAVGAIRARMSWVEEVLEGLAASSGD